MQVGELPRVWIEARKVHCREVISELLVSGDAFVVVDEIAAAIEHKFVSIDFNGPWVVRRVTVNQIHAAVEEAMSKSDMRIRNLVAPVVAPVKGHDGNVAALLAAAYSIQKLAGRCVGEIPQEIDAGRHWGGRPGS